MTAAARRRVLLLAYFFPPLGGGGVQRSLKYVKYLPDAGVDPIVVTTRLGWSPIRDATLDADVPASTVVVRAAEVPVQVLKWGTQRVLRQVHLPTKATAYIGWPDEMVGWVPGAIWQAIRAIRRYRPDVLYSTSSPVSAHLAALLVSRATGIPWVADFRDAWTANPQGERLRGPFVGLSTRLERAIVDRARFLVVVDDSVELLGLKHDDPRRVVIRNGVDPDDIPAPSPYVRGSRLRISYVGTLYGERDAAPVFAALRALVERGVIDPQRVEVRLVGHQASDTSIDLGPIALRCVGYVDHVTAIAEMAAADVLLFYAPGTNRGSSGKIYEYLAMGRPIFCVAGSDNFAFELVREFGAGPCAEPDDQPGIEAAITQLYRDWDVGRLQVDPAVRAEALRRFSRPALARELAAVLEAAAARTSRGRFGSIAATV
jgi:glycosyltransferase involved in cell wall biosynthesis